MNPRFVSAASERRDSFRCSCGESVFDVVATTSSNGSSFLSSAFVGFCCDRSSNN